MDESEFELALTQLEVTANNFAMRVISMAKVREGYTREIAEMSQSLREAVRQNRLSPAKGAEIAHGMRNQIMDTWRLRDMDLGRSLARNLKTKGLSFEQAIEKAMAKLGVSGQKFNTLPDATQRAVYEEVIEAAGRSRKSVTSGIPKLKWAARGLWIATALIAAYNIGTAEDPWWQSGREASNLTGGIAGSAAAGALAGIWFGPVGVAIGAAVGGIAGALLADRAYVEIAGVENAGVAPFIGRYTGFFSGVDVEGLARALALRYGHNPDFTLAVFNALDDDYSMSGDNVALAYVRLARKDPAIWRMIRGAPALRDKLAEMLESGWTSGDERNAATQLLAA